MLKEKESMSDNHIFRKKSVERLSSPESLSDYLHAATPQLWAVLLAVALLFFGMIVWGGLAIESGVLSFE